MAVLMKTPGVYVIEKNAFPNSIVEVATAVPAFVGYTERRDDRGRSLAMTPQRVASLAEYQQYFGGAPKPVFDLVSDDVAPQDADFMAAPAPGATEPTPCRLRQVSGRYFLYQGLRHFFQNGGGPCYVVSAGVYGQPVSASALVAGLQALEKEPEPTLLVVPDAVLLGDADSGPGDCLTVQQAMLAQCGTLRNRFAILDLWGGWQGKDDCVPAFRDNLGVNHLDFGAAYYPWLHSTVVQEGEIGHGNFADQAKTRLVGILGAGLPAAARAEIARLAWSDARWRAEAALRGRSAKPQEHDAAARAFELADASAAAASDASAKQAAAARTQSRVAAAQAAFDAAKARAQETTAAVDAAAPADKPAAQATADAAAAEVTARQQTLAQATAAHDAAKGESEAAAGAAKTASDAAKATPAPQLDQAALGWVATSRAMMDDTLVSIAPLFKTVRSAMRKRLNLLPPSSAMAGLYTLVDNTRGVWKAPANVSVSGVVAPAVPLSREEQEDLNVTPQGKSINAIRAFVGEGVLVWGARTLNGNSLDWRYVNVRRTMIMIEESCRLAAKALVFEPNVSSTWVSIKSMTENFLTSVWKRGGLAGAVPADAFSVHVGLGETMTPEDILEGILRVTVLVAVSRPAEFIEITFQQQMQKS